MTKPLALNLPWCNWQHDALLMRYFWIVPRRKSGSMTVQTLCYNRTMRHKENILRLRAEGKTYNQIRDELGCSKGTIAYHCGTGVKEKTKQRNVSTRDRQILSLREYKEKVGCVDCGEKYPHWMLDFDHLPEHEKLGSPTHLVRTLSVEKAWEEVFKCNVVCPNCHRIRSYARGTMRFKDN